MGSVTLIDRANNEFSFESMVFPGVKHLKVALAIVSRDAVPVMDMFLREELAAQMFLHH